MLFCQSPLVLAICPHPGTAECHAEQRNKSLNSVAEGDHLPAFTPSSSVPHNHSSFLVLPLIWASGSSPTLLAPSYAAGSHHPEHIHEEADK